MLPLYYSHSSHSDRNSLDSIRYRLNSLRWAVRIDNPREYVYIFNHIPKAAGTAVRQVLSGWGAVVSDYRRDTSEQATTSFLNQKVHLNRIRRPAFVCGHYGLEGAYLDQRYPEVFSDTRFRLFTFLREPLEIAVSHYFYAKRVGQKVAAADLDTFIRHYHGQLTRVLGVDGQNPKGLDAYWFVGVSERLTDSMRLLAAQTGRRYITPPVVNVTPRSAEPSAAAVAVFRENNAADEALYQTVCQRFDEQFSGFLASSDAPEFGA